MPRAVWAIVAVALVLHLLPRPGYGFHRDELLYLAMGDHLDVFRMQFPPLIAVAAEAARLLPLDLLAAIHLLAAIALALLMAVAVGITRVAGGNGQAQVLTALAVLVSPLFQRMGSMLQPVVFEHLWWAVVALGMVALLSGRDRRWWLVVGGAIGLGLLTKFSAGLFGLCLGIAVLLSPLRRDLAGRWPWLALLAAALLGLPALTGQQHWGWPFFAQMEALQARQLDRVSPLGFISGQALLAGAAAPLLLVGAGALAFGPALRPFRALGIFAAVSFTALLLMHGKEYYFGPLHAPLLAAGAVAAGPWLARRQRAWLAAVLFLAAGGALLLPMGVPLLPPSTMARYAAGLGVTRAVSTNYGTVLPLPQDYADMTGWHEQVATVAAVYHALPDPERSHSVIFGGNYGRTGAVAVYHREFGLPYPVSLAGDFYNWGPGQPGTTTVIVIGGDVEGLSRFFADVTEAARSINRWGVDEEQEVPIYICRKPRAPLPDLWRRLGPMWG